MVNSSACVALTPRHHHIVDTGAPRGHVASRASASTQECQAKRPEAHNTELSQAIQGGTWMKPREVHAELITNGAGTDASEAGGD